MNYDGESSMADSKSKFYSSSIFHSTQVLRKIPLMYFFNFPTPTYL